MYTTIVVLITVFVLLIWFLKQRNSYWKNRKVPYEDSKILFGNMWESIMGRKNIGEVFDYFYKKFDDAKYCGVMNFGTPTLLIRDPEVLERIFIKDFSKFHDNGFVLDEKRDPVLSKNPFFAKGEQWKLLRNQLTPQFSPLKIKNMFPLMDDVTDRMVKYLNENPNSQTLEGIDIRDLTLRYTTEMVASCAFGLYGNCFNEDNPEIVQISKKIFHVGPVDIAIGLLIMMFPVMNDIYPQQALKPEIAKWFGNVITSTLEERKKKNIKRGDFLDAIAEMKEKTTAFDYTTDHMTAHAISFFLDGSGTSAGVLQYTLYEIGRNKDVQKKLRNEIQTVLKENNGKMTYEKLHEMDYLDMVIHETLRLHPVVLFLLKECTETTVLPPVKPYENELVVEKKTMITIPIYSIHRDPQYYEEPEKFIPERFTKEAVAARPKTTFLGFGDGPRICLGRRFGLTLLKAAVYGVLSNFQMEINEKTPKQLVLDPIQFLYTTKGGMWLNFHPLHN